VGEGNAFAHPVSGSALADVMLYLRYRDMK
jgi:hypothetical protein